MRAHVLLEVEVSKLVTLLQLKKAGQLSVSINLATILGVLEFVLADISVNLASYLSASHLASLGLTKESGQLIADKGRLYKTTGIAVSSLALAFSNEPAHVCDGGTTSDRFPG